MGNKINVFKPSGGHQTWNNNFPPTPEKTEDYPYQAIVFLYTLVSEHVALVISKTPMELYYVSGETFIRLRAIDLSNIKIYSFNDKEIVPSSWLTADTIGEGANISFGESDGNHQFNYTVSGYVGDIFVSFPATIEQIYDYDALPTPFRIRNLSHFNSSFLQARTARIKKSYSEYARCNL